MKRRNAMAYTAFLDETWVAYIAFLDFFLLNKIIKNLQGDHT